MNSVIVVLSQVEKNFFGLPALTLFVTPAQANKSYQKDLLQQIDYLEESKQFEKLQVRDELAMCKEAESVHRRRVQEALNNPSPDKVHPTRIVLSGKSLL